ncbi:uncharacterized mitochondrial protein AtMg00860-like [Gossypium hirsutum]|uniref:Uncharacterized mitochondrial protein AtMg00860-like n=1 Tax=Gossypium hirsutum TaxID=3635 RepID=A0A1U8KGI9_GOSHI|nr:uncharacterized mitochondrial protein AtMg00860-like [Gossypium hirsutum]
MVRALGPPQRGFGLLRQHQLFFKKRKCSFGTDQVEYLGHIISKCIVSMDKTKVKSVATWPIPVSIKELRGFLGLSGYYRRFIKNYGVIARPLTNLLKKDAWGWCEQATVAFELLKQALCSAPILTLPNFSLEFYVDTDTSSYGVAAVVQ